MDDREVVEAFVAGGARHAFGSKLHIEGDCLVFDGWWEASFRISPDTFAVRDETPPEESSVLTDVASVLGAHGASEVEANPALLVAITYTSIDLGAADWTLWSTDAATAEAALAARAGQDTFLDDSPFSPPSAGTQLLDYAAEMGGARRSAGLPVHVVLTVGVQADTAATMAEQLVDCRVEPRALGEVRPDDCAQLLADLVLVDATSQLGADFLVDVRASGRFIPLVAISGAGPLLGADATVDPAATPAAWAEHIRGMLP
ncbi:MAG: hypothetical protein M3471_03465 [Actinomycetota bacterium]|nr:hypothetical protein [Actinomycetota bacterium]